MLLVLFWLSLYWSVTYIQKFLIRAMSCLFRCKTDWAMKSKFWITKKKKSVEILCLEFLFFLHFQMWTGYQSSKISLGLASCTGKMVGPGKGKEVYISNFLLRPGLKRTWKELWNFPSVCCFLYFEVCCNPFSVLTVRLAWIFIDVSLPKFIY